MCEIEDKAILNSENKDVWSMLSSMDYSGDLYIGDILISQVKKEYLRPNMFNGTYIFNGREYTIDLHSLNIDTTEVRVYPLESIYDNSSIFLLYNSRSGLYKVYKVYKEGSVYKVQNGIFQSARNLVDPNCIKELKYLEPTEKLVEYAEKIALLLGIDIDHNKRSVNRI